MVICVSIPEAFLGANGDKEKGRLGHVRPAGIGRNGSFHSQVVGPRLLLCLAFQLR